MWKTNFYDTLQIVRFEFRSHSIYTLSSNRIKSNIERKIMSHWKTYKCNNIFTNPNTPSSLFSRHLIISDHKIRVARSSLRRLAPIYTKWTQPKNSYLVYTIHTHFGEIAVSDMVVAVVVVYLSIGRVVCVCVCVPLTEN